MPHNPFDNIVSYGYSGITTGAYWATGSVRMICGRWMGYAYGHPVATVAIAIPGSYTARQCHDLLESFTS